MVHRNFCGGDKCARLPGILRFARGGFTVPIAGYQYTAAVIRPPEWRRVGWLVHIDHARHLIELNGGEAAEMASGLRMGVRESQERYPHPRPVPMGGAVADYQWRDASGRHACPHCPRRYRRAANFGEHVRTAHGIEPATGRPTGAGGPPDPGWAGLALPAPVAARLREGAALAGMTVPAFLARALDGLQDPLDGGSAPDVPEKLCLVDVHGRQYLVRFVEASPRCPGAHVDARAGAILLPRGRSVGQTATDLGAALSVAWRVELRRAAGLPEVPAGTKARPRDYRIRLLAGRLFVNGVETDFVLDHTTRTADAADGSGDRQRLVETAFAAGWEACEIEGGEGEEGARHGSPEP